LADPHFGTGQVGHDCHTPPHRASGSTDILNDLFMTREVAVREVEARYIHASSDHLFYDFRGLGSGSYGAYDFGFIGWKRHEVFPPQSLKMSYFECSLNPFNLFHGHWFLVAVCLLSHGGLNSPDISMVS
jgi:hypothetical protein